VKKVVDDIRAFGRNDFSVDVEQMQSQWDEIIRHLGEMGIKEAKPVFVAATHHLLTEQKPKFVENQDHLKGLLGFIKRLYVLERSIERIEDGSSEELKQLLDILLLQNNWVVNNQKETCQMLSAGLYATNNVFEFTEKLREAIDNPAVVLSASAL